MQHDVWYTGGRSVRTKMPEVCLHAFLGLGCAAPREEVCRCAIDTFKVLRRNVRANEPTMLTLGRQYYDLLHDTLPSCSEGMTVELATADAAAPADDAPAAPAKRNKIRRRESLPHEDAVVLVHDPVGVVARVEDFPAINVHDGRITTVFAKATRASYYLARHREDPRAFPLSRCVFSGRKALHMYASTHIYVTPDERARFRYEKLRAYWTYVDPDTCERHLSLFIVNEENEPRWGRVLCLAVNETSDMHWQQDMTTHAVPVVLKRIGGSQLRYCGHWTFERAQSASGAPFQYVAGGRPRDSLFTVSLSHYDDRWGECDGV